MSGKTLLVFPRAFEPNHVPPLGISLLGACLRDAGHEVELIDLTVEPMRRIDLARYGVVGMSLLCTNFPSGTRLARQIRQDNPAICIVAGGPFADKRPGDVLATGAFDAVAHGEGERVLPALVSAVARGADLTGVGGLTLRRDGALVRTPSPPMIEDLDALPFPAYDLLDMTRYPRHSVMASRGCPFGCIFCDRGPAETRRMRYHSPERVVDWIERMGREFTVLPVRILDSTFTLDQSWAEQICDLILARGLRVRWHCQTRIDCVNRTLIEKMHRAGCTELVAGVDSGNDDILRKSKKSLTKARARQGAQLFRDGPAPQLHLNFVIGHPWDTRETIAETISFAEELEDSYGAKCGYYMMVPFPGTELWDRASSYEIEITQDWEKYCKLSFTERPDRLAATFSSRHLTSDELTQIYHDIYKRKRARTGRRPALRTAPP
ncbi:MAG: radical SAM protein [Deltaproteobacteria bacterium]|nr:MAG: radical SAM protein [Deltaproteobacteria bacterium]